MEADTKTLANRIRVRKHHARRVVRNNPIRIPANLHMITPCRWVARHLGNIYAIQIGDPSARGNPMPKRIHERLAKLIPAEARQTAYASILRGLNDWHPVIIRQSRQTTEAYITTATAFASGEAVLIVAATDKPLDCETETDIAITCPKMPTGKHHEKVLAIAQQRH